MQTLSRPVSVKLDDGLRARLKHLADERQRTTHWVMREAIAQYVDREERRDAFKRATLDAWREYEETGLHLTGEEMDAWLAQLEAGEDAPMPACHR